MPIERTPIPDRLSHLPVARGMPVPHVVAWSSEGRCTIRYDPLVGATATFAKGRQGRGRPVFGVMAPDRQRAAVLLRRCLVCNEPLTDRGWLPMFDHLIEGKYDGLPVVGEPPACEPCARWSVTGCPGIRGEVTELLVVSHLRPIVQLVDPGAAPQNYARRFNQADTEADMARLSRAAGRRGVAGYVKFAVIEGEFVPADTGP